MIQKIHAPVLLLSLSLWLLAGDPPNDADIKETAAQLMKALGGQLKQQMQANGAEEAIRFCSLTAVPLTQQVSEQRGWKLSRVTDKPRNPANRANGHELQILAQMVKDQAEGKLKDIYRNAQAAYLPLTIQPLCLTCHGENLDPSLSQTLKTTYPQDEATGYLLDQIRGAVKLTW